MSTVINPRINQNLIYFYDLPTGEFTSVSLAKIIKEKTGHDIERQPQVRRDVNKPFYTAVVKITDNVKFSEVCKQLRYFDMNGKQCRALPFQNELLGSNITRLSENNIFVRKIPKHLYSQNLEEYFSRFGEIISCKVSLGDQHTARGYGFVCFREASSASNALAFTQTQEETIGVKFSPKDKKDFRKVYNNIYVKNLPATWTEQDVKATFSEFGLITSLYGGRSQYGPYYFICYGSADPNNRESGPASAEQAVNVMKDRTYADDHKLYVVAALKKKERENELQHETFKYKNSKKRCNLYVKGFPSTMTEEDLHMLFGKHGEIESLKLFPAKDLKTPFAFVCYKTPEQSSAAKTQLTQQQIEGHPLYINHYEIKQYREMQNEAQKDRQDFQRYQAENAGALTDFQNSDELLQLLRLLMHQGLLKKHSQTYERRPNDGQYQDRRQQYQNNNEGRPNQDQQQMRPPHNRNNMGQGGYAGGQQQQQHHQPRPQGQRPPNAMNNMPMPMQSMGMTMPQPMNMPMPMPITQGGMPMPMGQPNQNPTVKDYLSKTLPIVGAIVEQNPNYKEHVGSVIYHFVQAIAGPQAPKITGMLIDLPLQEIHAYMRDYNLLLQRVIEAKELLNSMH